MAGSKFAGSKWLGPSVRTPASRGTCCWFNVNQAVVTCRDWQWRTIDSNFIYPDKLGISWHWHIVSKPISKHYIAHGSLFFLVLCIYMLVWEMPPVMNSVSLFDVVTMLEECMLWKRSRAPSGESTPSSLKELHFNWFCSCRKTTWQKGFLSSFLMPTLTAVSVVIAGQTRSTPKDIKPMTNPGGKESMDCCSSVARNSHSMLASSKSMTSMLSKAVCTPWCQLLEVCPPMMRILSVQLDFSGAEAILRLNTTVSSFLFLFYVDMLKINKPVKK